MNKFQILVSEEKKETREKYGAITSMHEGYGVLAEELHEYFLEMIKKPAERDGDNILKELVQLASTSEIIAEDLGIISPASDEELKENSVYKEAYQALLFKTKVLLYNMTLAKNIGMQRGVDFNANNSEFYLVYVPKKELSELREEVDLDVFSA